MFGNVLGANDRQMFEPLEASSSDVPIYRQLADQILSLIAAKRLVPGDRLPSQRKIAGMANVNLTTVTRAFSILHERGVIDGKPGKGTVITAPKSFDSPRSGVSENPGLCDLSINRPATDSYLRALRTLLPKFSDDPRFEAVQDYHPPEGHLAVRTAMAEWASGATNHSDPGRIIAVNGAQHGLACTLGAIANPGQVVLADAITFQGFVSLCALQHVDLKPVEMDNEGMIPAAFEQACILHDPGAVYLMPNFHNPTTITLSMARRTALAEVARKHNVIIIEDDVYRPLIAKPIASIASQYPDITVYITSLSKCVAAGIRFGIVSAPVDLLRDIKTFLQVNCWSTSFSTGLTVTQLAEQGKLDEIIEEQMTELKARHKILTRILPPEYLHSAPTSPHAWLTLPEPWHGSGFTRAARAAGVCVLSSDAFTVDRNQAPVHAIRLNLNAARSRDELTQAANAILGVLSGGFRKVNLDV